MNKLSEIEVSVIINSLNRLELLKKALPNIIEKLSLAKISAGITIVDAGSTDGSVEYIKECLSNNINSNILLLDGFAYNGCTFSQGCNLAVAESKKLWPNIKWLLFFETDNFFKNQNPLKQAFDVIKANENFASVGFFVEKFSGDKIVYGNSRPSVFGFILGQSISAKLGIEQVKPIWGKTIADIKYSQTDIVFTSPLFVKFEAWQNVGGMDSYKFPFSDADADLCLSFLSRDYQNIIIMCNGVVHDNGNNLSGWSANRIYNYHQARYRLLIKHKPWSKFVLQIFLPLRHFAELALNVVISYNSNYVSIRKKLLLNSFFGYK